jgi:aminopeptidase N
MNSSQLVRIGGLIGALLIVFFATLSLPSAQSGSLWNTAERDWPLAGGEPVRHPIPDPGFDFDHFAIHLDFDLADERVDGVVEFRGRAVAAPLRRVSLHAVEFRNIEVADASGKALPFDYDGKMLRIKPPQPLAADEEFSARITYGAHPRAGLYFVNPEKVLDLPDRNEIWTQGEEEDNRHWYPCWDYPNDRATTEIRLTVPEDWKTVSNGKLVGISPGPRPGTAVHHWSETIPHVSYLTSFAAGNYEVREDEADGIKLMYLYPPGEWEKAQRVWRLTPDMMRYFNRVTGYRFPYAKYAQVTVTGLFAAMENVGATTFETRQALQDSASYPTQRYETVTMHELVHQWFGDLITCRDWSHLWLNEGFATYFDAVYTEYLEGPDEFTMRMRKSRDSYQDEDQDEYRRPIVEPVYTDAMDLFDSHAYPGAAWRLHMLRDVLTDFETGSDELFWRGIRRYLADYAGQSVRTDQFRLAMEQASGRDLDWFFDQWLYKAGYPELRIESAWDEDRMAYEIEVEQIQKTDSLTPLFRFPVTIEIAAPTGADLHRVWIEDDRELLSFPLSGPPRYVRFDRDHRVLKTLEWNRDTGSLVAQLESSPDAEGRIDACEALAERFGDEEALAALRSALLGDSFYGVRIFAAEALGKTAGDGALDVLLEAIEAPDPRVRLAVVKALDEFHGEERAMQAIEKSLSDTNSHIVAAAAGAIGRGRPEDAGQLLERALEHDSYRDCVRDSTLRAFASLGDTDHISTLIHWLDPENSPYSRRGAAIALGQLGSTLGQEAHEAERRQGIRHHLEQLLADHNGPVRSGAIKGLGSLGDPGALPTLIRIRDGLVGNFALAGRERYKADEAIKDILEHQARFTDRSALARRLQEIEEQNRELRRELEELRYRIQGRNPDDSGSVTRK